MISPSRNLSSPYPSIHSSTLLPSMGIEGFASEPRVSVQPSDQRDRCPVCVRSPLMCGAAQTQAQSISAHQFSHLLVSFSVSLLPFFLPPSYLFHFAVFSSTGRLPPLHAPGLIFHFQITVAHSCYRSRLFRSLFLQCTERKTQQRAAETQWAC